MIGHPADGIVPRTSSSNPQTVRSMHSTGFAATAQGSLARVAVRAGKLLAMALLAGLAACSGGDTPSFKGTDITGTHLGRDLALTDQTGQARTLASYSGKVQVYFFGFTQCPDVCPSALAEMAEVLKKLGSDAQHVQVALITVDPERDTQEVLQAYVSAFDPRFVALRGDQAQTRAAASTFKAYYARAPQNDGNYSMDHTAAFYIFDRKGEARVLASPNLGVDALVHDIRALL